MSAILATFRELPEIAGSYRDSVPQHNYPILRCCSEGTGYLPFALTLAAIGRELNIRKLLSAHVHLAVGLPLTWISKQKDEFRAYLLKNETADFNFRGKDYHVEFTGAEVFPQDFSTVADRLWDFKGDNMLCDIGNGTMNVMYINNGKPVPSKCFTEKYSTHQCMLAVWESLIQRFGTAVDDTVIENVLRFGTADIGEQYLAVIRSTATKYVPGIMRRLREHEYNPELMRLYVMGSGSCLVRNFGEYDKDRTHVLIQKGAILEKALPKTNGMRLEELEGNLFELARETM